MTEKNSLLDWALWYATEKGWFVFPCREVPSEPFWDKKLNCERVNDIKSPYIIGGFKGASNDPQTIEIMWKEHPNAAIGISCGHSGLVVIDIDVKNNASGYDNYMQLNIADGGALHSVTPSSGMHVIFSGETDSHSYGKLKIDIRSVGSYIVAPPSKILVGGEWKTYFSLDDWGRAPAPVPEDLIERFDLLRGRGERVERPKMEYSDTPEEMRKKIQKALSKLPMEYCDDRFLWVQVGLAVKSAGEEFFDLWDSWSRKSEKYHKEKNLYVWNNFNPRKITIASLFYFAKESEKEL